MVSISAVQREDLVLKWQSRSVWTYMVYLLIERFLCCHASLSACWKVYWVLSCHVRMLYVEYGGPMTFVRWKVVLSHAWLWWKRGLKCTCFVGCDDRIVWDEVDWCFLMWRVERTYELLIFEGVGSVCLYSMWETMLVNLCWGCILKEWFFCWVMFFLGKKSMLGRGYVW